MAQLHRLVRKHSQGYLPDLHAAKEDEEYFAAVVFRDCDIWVAEKADIIGYVAFRSGWVEHLYVHPRHQRSGLGSTLLNKAQESNCILELWLFERNHEALHFYQHHGFVQVERTDGRANEEKMPDVRMRWERSNVRG